MLFSNFTFLERLTSFRLAGGMGFLWNIIKTVCSNTWSRPPTRYWRSSLQYIPIANSRTRTITEHHKTLHVFTHRNHDFQESDKRIKILSSKCIGAKLFFMLKKNIQLWWKSLPSNLSASVSMSIGRKIEPKTNIIYIFEKNLTFVCTTNSIVTITNRIGIVLLVEAFFIDRVFIQLEAFISSWMKRKINCLPNIQRNYLFLAIVRKLFFATSPPKQCPAKNPFRHSSLLQDLVLYP